jgi:hypothetical protein
VFDATDSDTCTCTCTYNGPRRCREHQNYAQAVSDDQSVGETDNNRQLKIVHSNAEEGGGITDGYPGKLNERDDHSRRTHSLIIRGILPPPSLSRFVSPLEIPRVVADQVLVEVGVDQAKMICDVIEEALGDLVIILKARDDVGITPSDITLCPLTFHQIFIVDRRSTMLLSWESTTHHVQTIALILKGYRPGVRPILDHSTGIRRMCLNSGLDFGIRHLPGQTDDNYDSILNIFLWMALRRFGNASPLSKHNYLLDHIPAVSKEEDPIRRYRRNGAGIQTQDSYGLTPLQRVAMDWYELLLHDEATAYTEMKVDHRTLKDEEATRHIWLNSCFDFGIRHLPGQTDNSYEFMLDPFYWKDLPGFGNAIIFSRHGHLPDHIPAGLKEKALIRRHQRNCIGIFLLRLGTDRDDDYPLSDVISHFTRSSPTLLREVGYRSCTNRIIQVVRSLRR